MLFVSTIALVVLETRNMPGTTNAPTPITSSTEKSERIKALRAYIKEQEGTTTSIIVKSSTK